MSGLPAQRCTRCATIAFPARLLCPCCGSPDREATEILRGVVEETTTLDDTMLASVRLTTTAVAIARIEGGATRGDAVELEVVDGAVVARRS